MVLVGPIPSALSDGGDKTRNGNGNKIVCVVCLSRCIVFSLLFSAHFSPNFSRISFLFCPKCLKSVDQSHHVLESIIENIDTKSTVNTV